MSANGQRSHSRNLVQKSGFSFISPHPFPSTAGTSSPIPLPPGKLSHLPSPLSPQGTTLPGDCPKSLASVLSSNSILLSAIQESARMPSDPAPGPLLQFSRVPAPLGERPAPRCSLWPGLSPLFSAGLIHSSPSVVILFIYLVTWLLFAPLHLPLECDSWGQRPALSCSPC